LDYQDGKNALIKYRLLNPKVPGQMNPMNPLKEYEAVRNGINYFSNFYDAIFFPFTLCGRVMPSIVMYLNKNN
jgi:hypothetical protein